MNGILRLMNKTSVSKSTDEKVDLTIPMFKRGGVVLGKYKRFGAEDIAYIGEDSHLLCIGATRSGKSRTVVLQSIGLQALAGENIICSDPKGELFQYTFPYLERLGYKVKTLDFKNPLKSSRYNFLQTVSHHINQRNVPKAIEAAWNITSSLVPSDSHNEQIWANGEQAIIGAAIMAVICDNVKHPEFQNLTNVYHFIAEMCKSSSGDLLLNKYTKTLPEDHPARALLAIAEVAPSKTRGSFFTSALTTLRLFTNPFVSDMTSECDITAEDMDNEKTALFIILPDEKVTYYSLAALFINQFYERLVNVADERGGRLKKRVNFNLDEFGNFMKIPDFPNKLTVGGGRGIRFNLFVQDTAQIESKYGDKEATTIKSNCHVWLYLQSDDPVTQKLISDKLGNYTVATSSHSTQYNGTGFNPGNVSASSNLTGRPLLTPDEVSRIKRPFSLVTTRTYPAIMRSPDLSMWYFNKMFGLGDPEHNRMVREERENRRDERTCDGKPALWGIWNMFSEKPKQNYSGTRRNYQRVSGIQEIPKDITGKEGYSDEIRQNIKKQD